MKKASFKKNIFFKLFGASLALFFVAFGFQASAAEPIASSTVPKATLSEAEPIADTDGDGFNDQVELTLYHTDPLKADTDGDGFDDFQEVSHGYSPRHAEPTKLNAIDSDADGAADSWEIRLGLDLLNPDTDGDGFSDGDEIDQGHDPRSADAGTIEKFITVSLAGQELAYSFNGVLLDRFAVSTGVRSMPTPTGEFSILDKVPTKVYGGTGYDFYYPNTKWNLHFTTKRLRYYIHGAYWHNNFGRPMSHGCVNVAYPNMERLYQFAQVGTKVEIS